MYDANGGYVCSDGNRSNSRPHVVEAFFSSAAFPSPQDAQDKIMSAATAAQLTGTTQMSSADAVRSTANASQNAANEQIRSQSSAGQIAQQREQALISDDSQNAVGLAGEATRFTDSAVQSDANFMRGLQQTRLV